VTGTSHARGQPRGSRPYTARYARTVAGRWTIHRVVARTRIRLAKFRPEPLDVGTALLSRELGDSGVRHRVSFAWLSVSSAGADSTIPSAGKRYTLCHRLAVDADTGRRTGPSLGMSKTTVVVRDGQHNASFEA